MGAQCLRCPLLRRPFGFAVVAAIAVFADAQRTEAQSEANAAATVAAIADGVEEEFACSIELYGEPRAAGFDGDWLVAYAASGADCDAAQAALQSRAEPAGFEFMRRPNLPQLRALLAPMIRSAELASGCRIALHGRPEFDSSTGRWSVHVGSDGAACATAIRDLAAQAADFEIVVLRSATRTLQRE